MLNAPDVKLAIVGVSRDCFPIDLTRTRLGKLAEACKKIGLEVYVAETIIENEVDANAALDEVLANGANAAVVYLGNFGPEGPGLARLKPEAMLAHFDDLPELAARLIRR
ncbi:hypothetical protein EOM89_12280 [Candidatus Falkowbacteria bacterium]|nr:hypothetical protein [Candidatus Falkowbacteria bacterium]